MTGNCHVRFLEGRIPAMGFGYSVGGRPGFAADAGLMEIQTWEGAVLRCVEAVLRSATATGMRVNEDAREKL
jgi:hypothetical protein